VARIVAGVLALVGLAASASLLAPYVTAHGLCTARGCEEVANSAYGKLFGVPRAAIGVVAFLVALAFVLVGGARARRLAPIVGLAGALEGAHLIAVQAFVLKVFCPFCLVADCAAIAMGAALLVEAIASRRSEVERPSRFVIVGAVAALAALFVPLGIAQMKSGPRSRAIAAVQDKDGKLVIREFVDLECPFCRATHLALQKVIGARVDVVIERHHVPYPQHPHAMQAAIAACCAGEQGAEDGFVDGVIHAPAPPDDAVCRMVATKLSLDLAKWDDCRGSDRPKARITADEALADATGVDGLPTIDVEGERVVGELDETSAAALIARHGH
jgi:protein-disulfide isomerase